MTQEEKIADLERQLAEMKKQSADEKRRQVSNHLISVFAVDDDDDIIVAHTVEHLGITETTDIDAIISEAEEAYKRNCQRAGRELPQSAEEWCADLQKRQAVEAAEAEELRKSMC